MIEKTKKECECNFCKERTEVFKFLKSKKKFLICSNCLNILYTEIGKLLIPKSPTSVLKKDNKIKIERF